MAITIDPTLRGGNKHHVPMKCLDRPETARRPQEHAHIGAAGGLCILCKKHTLPNSKRLTSSQGASFIAREDAPASAIVPIVTFEPVRAINGLEVRSKNSVIADPW
jgi:hypothetical protein